MDPGPSSDVDHLERRYACCHPGEAHGRWVRDGLTRGRILAVRTRVRRVGARAVSSPESTASAIPVGPHDNR